jgi:hypothetical protein
MMPIVPRTLCLFVGAIILVAAVPALAQRNTVTCTGTLIDVWLKPKAEWPLAVICDAAGGYTCSIDRTGAGHDPKVFCSPTPNARYVPTTRHFLPLFDPIDHRSE